MHILFVKSQLSCQILKKTTYTCANNEKNKITGHSKGKKEKEQLLSSINVKIDKK